MIAGKIKAQPDAQVRDSESERSSPWGEPKRSRSYGERDVTRERAPREPRADVERHGPWQARPEATRTRSERPIRPYGRASSEAMELNLGSEATPRRELRIYGRHAVLGVARFRPEAIRKVYYHRSAQNDLAEVLRWCAANKVGYREVELDDLTRLASTEHHEGVIADIVRAPNADLDTLLAALAPQANACLILLDGVANPHNFGAILRNAAHFGASGILLAPRTQTDLSGAAYRVAEGGAEAQPIVHLRDFSELAKIKAAGFSVVGAHTRQSKSLWQHKFAKRSVLVFGAEGAGLSEAMLAHCDARVAIPGSGVVESLNVAQSVAVLLAETQRQLSR